jgi:hypothetical protein
MKVLALGTLLAAAAIAACQTNGNEWADGDGDGDVDCAPLAITCDGETARTCNARGDGWAATEECTGGVCAPGVGCASCRPGTRQCQGTDAAACNADGTGWDVVEACDGECSGGYCGGACAHAESVRSYEGCEYRAVTLMNSELPDDFVPAIVVGNQNAEAATVTVTRGGAQVAEATVAPGSTATIELPWVLELKQEYPMEEGDPPEQSANVADGSYRVVSTLPVTVYQFNPLEYALDHECASTVSDDDPTDNRCYSYTNDASLLLPVQVLSEHYLVMSRANRGEVSHEVYPPSGESWDYASFAPGIMAVINPGDQPVDVDITFSAPTQAGPGLAAYEAGQADTFTIAPGGVLQIAARIPETCTPDSWDAPYACEWDGVEYECTEGYCAMQGYDLTGTEVSASAPVAVFGGHNCAYIPYNRWACDHLEEQLFPFETWGTHYLVSQSQRENGEPDVIRVLSGADGNQVTFTPVSAHAPVTLDRGEFVEFEAHGALEVASDGPVLVGQFMVGQNYTGNDAAWDELPPGDPSFSLAVPIEQYRSSYSFLAPSTYDRSYVNVTVPEAGTGSIELDGSSLAGEAWEAVEGTGYSTLRLEIDAGSHAIGSSAGATFGILVYGYGQYTSYMYTGGLALEEIAVW